MIRAREGGPVLETMRAFVALNLDVASVRRIADAARRLRASELAPQASWTAPTKMHVTLKFFGSIDVGLAPALVDTLRPLAEGKSATRLRIVGFTAFPSPEHARVIVAELEDPSGDLTRLQEDVDERCDALGFEREGRSYRPHVTVARTRTAVDARAWLDADARSRAALGDAIATELVLFRSDLARSGAEYTALFRASYTITRASRRSERPAKASSRRPSRMPSSAPVAPGEGGSTVPVSAELHIPPPPRLPSEAPQPTAAPAADEPPSVVPRKDVEGG